MGCFFIISISAVIHFFKSVYLRTGAIRSETCQQISGFLFSKMDQDKIKIKNIPKDKEFDLFCRRLAEIIFFEIENNKRSEVGKENIIN